MPHLYFHVPFCRRRCSYCDFSIAVRKRIPAGEYVAAVRTELAALRTSSGWADPGAAPRGSWETIYFGGGTPSLLPPEAIRTLLLNAVPSTSSLHDVEVTLEANPEDVTPKSATAWRHAGVNRISLGAQSFDDRVLRWMHRPHDAARIGAAMGTLRAAGFDDVSLDLIFALPAELGRDWRRDLDAAIRLAPAHLSLYGLTVEARTPLARWVSRGAASAPDDDRYAEEYLLAHERLGAAGFVFYEVSNAARDGARSRHNSAYWSGRPYRGLGPAAHSFDGRSRFWNLSAWEAYRRAVAAGRSPVEAEEVLTNEQRELERIYLGLRTAEGISQSDCPTVRQSDWVRSGWVEVVEGRVVCRPEGWLRLDALVRDLTLSPASS
ncbi:MAG: coproporphyrinogen III oxidase [Gemmatimonadetes bacterium]|nr:MAG: coproporphyrinogen III oxidase [Gemmatimonadota bacterium]PYP61366.1 MAG: coproporphyrinogen III oxidase [Gemmatimonadota bacterium]